MAIIKLTEKDFEFLILDLKFGQEIAYFST